MEDIQNLFQQIYGRPGSESEVAAVSGMSPEQITGILNTSLANFNAQQANGIAGLAQQQMQNAQTAAPAMSAEEKNFIDWQLAQRPDPFTTPGGYNTFADFYQAKGIDPYGAEGQKFAKESIARWNPVGDIRERVYGANNEWEDPNWQTVTALERAAAEAQRVQGANNPGPFSIGPSGPAKPQNLTLDPTYASILGNVDPTTALRAVNIMKYGPGTYKQSGIDPTALALANRLENVSLPKATLDKLFPAYAPSGVSALAAQQMQNAATPATPPAPTTPSTSSGVTVKDYEGNPFDAGTTLNLAKQIGSSFDAKNSSGSAFTTQGQSIGFDYDQAKQILGKDPSAAQQVLLDISRALQKKGINDLSQIGVRTVDVERQGYDGTRTEQQKEFYNKTTGDRIAGQGESIGSTFTGKGGTYYNLDVGSDGKPTFSTKAASTSEADIAAMALPLLLGPVAQTVLGASVPSFLSSSLTATGLPQAAANALAQGVLSGATSSLFGGDFVKGFVGGAANPLVSAGIGSVLPAGFAQENPAMAKFITNAGTSAVQGALSGKDVNFGQMLQNSALSGIAGTAMDKAGIPAELAPTLVSLARSGTITPQAAMQMMTQMGRKG